MEKFVKQIDNMKSNWCDFIAVDLLLVLWIVSILPEYYALDTGTVAPLNPDNPVSSEKVNDNKDLKKLETRFNDPPPEYYKYENSCINQFFKVCVSVFENLNVIC